MSLSYLGANLSVFVVNSCGIQNISSEIVFDCSIQRESYIYRVCELYKTSYICVNSNSFIVFEECTHREIDAHSLVSGWRDYVYRA